MPTRFPGDEASAIEFRAGEGAEEGDGSVKLKEEGIERREMFEFEFLPLTVPEEVGLVVVMFLLLIVRGIMGGVF
ncbi:MAG: hypothetical protein D6679_01060 [Candidatus Hydrogenedentota bacterium]|nr:MAG: hypothetical protein D6679_01060 [Candidatus Hydrogenedentota bacterium]